MEQVSDDDLMRLYGDGDADAFDALFDRHYASVYNFARTMLGNRGGPDEVLQETFLAVAQNAEKYAPRGRFRPWLMRIARNLCLNRIQADRLRRAAMAGSDLVLTDRAAESVGPAETVDSDERTAAIRAAIAALPDSQREAITLYAFEQMSYREIAEVMEAPINTVKTLIRRGRASLARKLESLPREGEHEL
jgi:RNA polymerase sigma-70 factor (ECF subfamily)